MNPTSSGPQYIDCRLDGLRLEITIEGICKEHDLLVLPRFKRRRD
jgi:hypothetical protein